jgi:CheY-like chemotaxis protein
MTAETRARVFDPFFTTKPTGQGTGMGLATVYGIVKQHQGNIWVRSEPDQGTTFDLFFPSAEAGEKTRETPETAALRGKGETVLLVEDEPSVRHLVRQVLDRRGYAVLEMESPEACLEFLEGCNAPIDLLLTDVVMPGMNGRELHRRIAETRPELKALYMSGYTENVIVHHGVLDPGVALLHKPFSVKELARKVREALDGPQ